MLFAIMRYGNNCNDLIEHNFNLFKRKTDIIYHDCVAFGQKFIKYIDFEKDFLAPNALNINQLSSFKKT